MEDWARMHHELMAFIERIWDGYPDRPLAMNNERPLHFNITALSVQR